MAAFIITCDLTIGNVRLNRASEIKVVSGWKSLVDTCDINLPFAASRLIEGALKRESLAETFKAGDRVEVKMGLIGIRRRYEFEEFKGFVRTVSPTIPMQLHCEDAVYLLRALNLEKTWRGTSLKEVVKYIVDEANKVNSYKITLHSKIPDVKFDKFRLDNVNGVAALEKIRDEYGLVVYFRDLELYAGIAFQEDVGRVKYNLQWNIPSEGVNLTYKRAEDTKIKLKAVAIKKDNSQIEVEVGAPDGELRTQFYYNISDKSTLKKVAQNDLEKLRYEGYEGSIETFLVPFVKHGMIAEIADPEYRNRLGDYMVDEVETVFGHGIKRVVRIGRRA